MAYTPNQKCNNLIHYMRLEHRKSIEEGIKRGDSLLSISKIIDFSDKGIRKEIARNSVNGIYNAEIAQRLSDERKLLRMTKARSEIHKFNNIPDRIAALEEIIKTLSELIKDIYDKINN